MLKLIKTKIKGCFVIPVKIYKDNRGSFTELYNKKNISKLIKKNFVQENYSISKKNVFRGMHLQIVKPQGKLLNLISGAIDDIILDLRKKSPTFGKSICIQLSEKKYRQVWIPPGLAHGFLSKQNDTRIIYNCTENYNPKLEKCISYNDKRVSRFLKGKKFIISDKDKRGIFFEEFIKISTFKNLS